MSPAPIRRDAGLRQSDGEQSCSTDEQGPRNARGAIGRDHRRANGQGERSSDERPGQPSSHPLSLPQVTIE
jgi:hypothetical protein